MCYRNSALCLADTCVTCRIVHGIAGYYRSPGSHGSPPLPFLHSYPRTPRWKHPGAGVAMTPGCPSGWSAFGKSDTYFCNLARTAMCCQHSVLIHQQITGKVQDTTTPSFICSKAAALIKSPFGSGIHQRYMDW